MQTSRNHYPSNNMSTTPSEQQSSHSFVSNRAAALDAKRSKEGSHAEMVAEKQKAADSSLPMGERLTAACHVAVQAGNEAVLGVQSAVNSFMANNTEKQVSRDLDRKFENGPDVRTTDKIHYQHDTTPHDVDPTHKGQENLIENRKIAIEAHQAAAGEEWDRAVAHAEKESAESFSEKAAASMKEAACSLKAKSYEATAAARNHKAQRDAREIFPDQHE